MPKASSVSLASKPATAPVIEHSARYDSDERSRSRPRNGLRKAGGATDQYTTSPQSPTSPHSARPDTRFSRSVFSPGASSSKLQQLDSSPALLDPPDPPYRKSQNSSSASLSNNPSADTASLASSSVAAEEDGSAAWKHASAKTSARSDAQETTSKKGSANRRMFNLLSRTQSIRTSENAADLPRSRSRPFGRHIATAQRERLAKEGDLPQTAPQTAPLEPEPGFREMTLSKRNHSADRAPKEDNETQLQKQNSSNTFFSNFKSHGSRAAEELRSAGKGVFSKFSNRERAPPEKYTNLDNYRFTVINRPLIDQTRISRVAKSMGDAYDKTQYWMPSLPYRCIEYLNLHGTEEEGLYRLSGSAREIKKWQVKFDTGPEYDVQLLEAEDLYDINAISSMFKAWLRDLPDEILPKSVQDRIADHCAGEATAEAPQLFRDELSKLPPHNYYLLFAITCHISLLHSNREKNKMNYQNLCICFQPCMKMDALCFQFLVCDWRNCWQGCWTEPDYLAKEHEAMEYLAPIGSHESGLEALSAASAAEVSSSRIPQSTDGSRPSTGPSQNPRGSEAVARSRAKDKKSRKQPPSDPRGDDAVQDEETSQDAEAGAVTPPAPTLSPVAPISPMRGFT